MARITVIMSQEVYDKVIKLGEKEKRKKSPMAAMLIEDGLKLAEKKVVYDNVIMGNKLHEKLIREAKS